MDCAPSNPSSDKPSPTNDGHEWTVDDGFSRLLSTDACDPANKPRKRIARGVQGPVAIGAYRLLNSSDLTGTARAVNSAATQYLIEQRFDTKQFCFCPDLIYGLTLVVAVSRPNH